jgi:DNA (cytosine-5)-methyltransferase 1
VNLTFGELFAGVGGFSLGFEQAGWRCRWQVEWDKHCQSVLARHWPEVARYGDVQHCDGNQLAPVDCITFGSPCQDLSVAGKRAGLAGERSGLFHQAIRIIKEMRDATAGTFPRYAIWENVAGALSSNKGDDFLAVIDAFAEVGAVDVAWRLVDAQFFGVPQRRRRVFVVADFAGECAGALHVEPAGVRWHPAPSREAGQETADSVGIGITGDTAIGGTLGSHRTGSYRNDLDGSSAFVVKIAPSLQASGPPATRRDDYESLIPIAEAYSRTSFAGYTAGIGTLATTDHKRPDMHVVPNCTSVRRLTPVECERLMGWPDDHTRWRADGTEQADSHRYRQCGNGVAAPVAAWLAWNLRTATEQDLNQGDNQ